MRFVAVKTREQQSQGMLFRTGDLLVRQRTQTINALGGHGRIPDFPEQCVGKDGL